MLSISTFRLNFINMNLIVPFFSLIYLKESGISIAILHMCVSSYLNEKAKEEKHCKTAFSMYNQPSNVYHYIEM